MKRRPGANRRAARLPTPAPAAAPPGPDPIVTDGLALHLDAGDAASYPGTGTTWTDLITSTAFTFQNTPTYNSDIGFFNFAGNNHAAGAPNPAVNPTLGAVEIWFRWRAFSNLSVAVLLSGATNWASIGNVTGNLGDESLEFYTGVAAAMDFRRGHFFLRDSEWHQMVAVVDGVANKLYIDGVEIINDPIPPGSPTYFRTGNATSTGLMNLATVKVGKYQSGYNFDGDIAVVRVYDTGAGSFSAADVAQNYAATSPRFSGGTFSPDQIGRLALWFDPSDASTVTLAGNNIDIDVVQDKAMAIADAKIVPTASGSNPASIANVGGINWMSFDGSNNEWMQAKNGSSLLGFNTLRDNNSWEMHVVAQVLSAPNNTAAPNGAQIIGDSGGWIGINTRTANNADMLVAPWVYGKGDGETTVSASTTHIFGSGMSGGSADIHYYTDGTATTLSSGGDLSSGSTIQLGRAYNSSFSTVRIGEVLIFDGELTSSQRTDLISYLQAKWG